MFYTISLAVSIFIYHVTVFENLFFFQIHDQFGKFRVNLEKFCGYRHDGHLVR